MFDVRDEVPTSRGVMVMTHYPKVVLVGLHQKAFLEDAAEVLVRAGYQCSPLSSGPSDDGALMLWIDEGATEQTAFHVATVLSDGGFDALAYEEFHDHELGHSHAFRRLRTPMRSVKAFVGSHLLVSDSCLWDVWVFGTSDSVEDAAKAADELGIAFRRIDGPEGLMCGEVTVRSEAALSEVRDWLDRFEWSRFPSHVTPLPAGSDYEDTV